MTISELLQAFSQLTDTLSQLEQRLQDEQPGIFMTLPSEQADSPLQQAQWSVKDIWYRDNEDGRATRSYPGFIAASPALLNQVNAVNKQKTVFGDLVKAMKSQDRKGWLESQEQLLEQGKQLREGLQFSGLSRLHLKQSSRRFAVLEHTPAKIGFSWYNHGKSIKKVSVKTARKQLQQLDTSSDHILWQLDKLNSMKDQDVLAQVQELAPVVRANIVTYTAPQANAISHTIAAENHPSGQEVLRKATIERKSMNCSLPIFFPLKKNSSLPETNQLPAQPPAQRTRLRRSDQQLESEVFLPSLRIYRYRQFSDS